MTWVYTMPDNSSVTARKREMARLKVFISYSRNDSHFTAELEAGLRYDGGFDILIDRESIHEGEPWRARVRSLILEADTVIVVLSPSWFSSETCQWEFAETCHNTKRIIPVQALPLEHREPPPQLAAINYVRFDHAPNEPRRLFMDGLSRLRSALTLDLDWVREHTRLLLRATEWDAAGRVENRMLSGSDIVAAKKWLEGHPGGAPEPTELQRDYIAACERAESLRLSHERKRAETLQIAVNRTRSALVAAVALALVAGFAGITAYRKKVEASTQRDAALEAQSLYLADVARKQAAAGDFTTAMLLSLSGLPEYTPAKSQAADRPYVPEAESRLYESYATNREFLVLGHKAEITSVALSRDGRRLATGSVDGDISLWDAAEGKKLLSWNAHEGQINAMSLSLDGQTLLSAGNDGFARVWDAISGKELRKLDHNSPVLSVGMSDTGRMITGAADKIIRLWSPDSSRAPQELEKQSFPITSVAISGDGLLVF